MGVRDLIDLAWDYPRIFLQLCFDSRIAARADDGDGGKPDYRKAGERPEQARDRLRAEREQAKRRLEGQQTCTASRSATPQLS